MAGSEVAGARQDYGGDPVSDAKWARVFAAFGPHAPDADELARRVRDPEVAVGGMEQLLRLDVIDQLAHITSPTRRGWPNTGGWQLTIKDLRGKIVLLDF